MAGLRGVFKGGQFVGRVVFYRCDECTEQHHQSPERGGCMCKNITRKGTGQRICFRNKHTRIHAHGHASINTLSVTITLHYISLFCRSVGLSVCRSVGLSVCRSVGLSVIKTHCRSPSSSNASRWCKRRHHPRYRDPIVWYIHCRFNAKAMETAPTPFTPASTSSAGSHTFVTTRAVKAAASASLDQTEAS